MNTHVNSLLAQTEGGMMVVFLKQDWEKRRVHGEISKSNWFLQETKKVSPFVRFEIILPLLCYLSDPTTNNYISVRRSITNKILWIDSRMCQMTSLVTAGKA